MRNASNALVTDAPVGVRVSILQGSADGNVVYLETHTAVTNANGLLTVEIGGGKVEQGTFAGIDWANGPYFLKTETDPNGGSDYGVTITQQLLSVPYALYAKEAANGFSGDYNDLKNKPTIPQNVGELTNDAGYITLGDIPTTKSGGEANNAGVVQTEACGEIDLCEMANQLSQVWEALLPTVTTGAVDNVTETTATCGGNVTAVGYSAVTARGVCWDTESNPTVDGSHTSNGTGTGSFTSSITGQTANTTYYVRAYATNSVGTAYGEEVSFTTSSACATLALPYSENFDSYTTSSTLETGVQPDCWDVIAEDVALTDATKPQIYRGYATSGSYSLRMKNRCVYAMPALDESVNIQNLTMTFNVRMPKSFYRLQVGVLNEAGEFKLVKTVKPNSTNMEQITVNFSNYTSGGHRIAFRNTLLSGVDLEYSICYIDDITLDLRDGSPCFGAATVTDHEGNVYNTVKIGDQCWTKENLRTTTSPSTGTYLIPPAGTGSTYTGKQARWYNNDSATYAPMNYGLLYNWNAAVDTFNTAYGETSVNTSYSNAVWVTFTGYRRGICPAGWHLPSDAEWTTLTDYVGANYACGGSSNSNAKALASETGWNSYGGGCYPGDQSVTANNASGFSAVPAGYCYGSSFYAAGVDAFFWSATQYYSNGAYNRYLANNHADVIRNGYDKDNGYSVRCLRD